MNVGRLALGIFLLLVMGIQNVFASQLTANGSWSNSGGRSSTSSSNPRYTFQVTSSGTVTINLTSAGDAYLYLLNSSGSVVAQDDDSGGNRNSRISTTLSSGTYTLVAATYSSGQSGSFSLSVQGNVANLQASGSGGGGSSIDPAINALIAGTSRGAIYSNNNKLRVIYLVPRDKQENASYRNALKHMVLNIQDWYLEKLNYRQTFTLVDQGSVVEVLNSTRESSWYTRNPGSDKWIINTRAEKDVNRLLGNRASNETWVIYVDAERSLSQCNSEAVNGLHGGGGKLGITVMPADDLNGLIQNYQSIICKTSPGDDNNPLRWVGGAAHEIGHSFGLPHPSGVGRQCDKPSCLMEGLGYTLYPATDLTEVGKDILRSNPLFSSLPLIDSSFNSLETMLGFQSQRTRRYTYNGEYVYYRRYSSENYLVVKGENLYTVVSGYVENKGSIYNWFSSNVSRINQSSSDYLSTIMR